NKATGPFDSCSEHRFCFMSSARALNVAGTPFRSLDHHDGISDHRIFEYVRAFPACVTTPTRAVGAIL
ncbi:hypothetical protein V5785_22695, partial [Bacillus subtilis]